MALIGIFFGLLIRRSLVRVQVGEPNYFGLQRKWLLTFGSTPLTGDEQY